MKSLAAGAVSDPRVAGRLASVVEADQLLVKAVLSVLITAFSNTKIVLTVLVSSTVDAFSINADSDVAVGVHQAVADITVAESFICTAGLSGAVDVIETWLLRNAVPFEAMIAGRAVRVVVAFVAALSVATEATARAVRVALALVLAAAEVITAILTTRIPATGAEVPVGQDLDRLAAP